MRLDKYIASVTDYSRSQVKALLREGRISVDGQPVGDPGMAVSEHSAIALDGAPLRVAGHRYFMLYKPEGYICATSDREHLTVISLLDEDNLDQLHIAGRLDIDATGLVLITDDGQWAHRVMSPRHDCEKTYWLETADPIPPAAVEKFAQGIFLHNEKRRTAPAVLTLIDEHSAELTIREGKYHQVKRMFGALGNKVDLLHRRRIGAIVLDEDLQPGEYRALSAEEVASV